MLRSTVAGVLLLLVNVVTAGAVELTADFSKKVSHLTAFWNGGGWDNEQVVDAESEKHNWMFDIDPKNTKCIYQQEQIVGTIPGGDFYQRPTMPMSNFTVRGLETGTPTYDWSELDTWLDVSVRSGNRLIFELISPANPTDAQIRQLRDGHELGAVGSVTDLKGASATLNFKLPGCGVSLILLSADPGAPPPQVTRLYTTRYRALSNQQDDVMVKWSDAGSRLIKTYEVYKSDTADGPYTRVNTPDIICTGSTCPVRLGARAFFKVRAADYWGRPGAFSDVAVAEQILDRAR